MDSATATTPQEQVYYGDGEVWVTDRRVVFAGYEVELGKVGRAYVRSVNTRAQDKQMTLSLLAISTVAMLSRLAILVTTGGNVPSDWALWLYSVFTILFLVAAIRTFFFYSSDDTVHTVVGGRIGRKRVMYASMSRPYCAHLVEAINYALQQNRGREEAPWDWVAVSPNKLPLNSEEGARERSVVLTQTGVISAGRNYSFDSIARVTPGSLDSVNLYWWMQIPFMGVLWFNPIMTDVPREVLPSWVRDIFLLGYLAIVGWTLWGVSFSGMDRAWCVYVTLNTDEEDKRPKKVAVYASMNENKAKEVEADIRQALTQSQPHPQEAPATT